MQSIQKDYTSQLIILFCVFSLVFCFIPLLHLLYKKPYFQENLKGGVLYYSSSELLTILRFFTKSGCKV